MKIGIGKTVTGIGVFLKFILQPKSLRRGISVLFVGIKDQETVHLANHWSIIYSVIGVLATKEIVCQYLKFQ